MAGRFHNHLKKQQYGADIFKVDEHLNSAMRQYDRPAGLSPLKRDASPQFIEGLRNDTYVSPTFKSSVFTAHEDRRATQERLRSANRDHFGNEIYRGYLEL